MAELVIIGAGGFAREVLDVAEAAGVEVEGFVADPAPPDMSVLARPYLGPVGSLEGRAGTRYVIGIGDGSVRRRIDGWAVGYGLVAAQPLIHPTATMSRYRVEFAPGVVVCAHVSMTTNIRVGRHTHLNLSCTVGHDCSLGDFVTVSPLVAVSGNVTIGDGATIGTGAAIREQIHIGRGATVGAGSAVVRDVERDVTVAGVPARTLSPR